NQRQRREVDRPRAAEVTYSLCSSNVTVVDASSFTLIFFAGCCAERNVAIITTPEVLPSQPTGIGRTILRSADFAIVLPLSSSHSMIGVFFARSCASW